MLGLAMYNGLDEQVAGGVDKLRLPTTSKAEVPEDQKNQATE